MLNSSKHKTWTMKHRPQTLVDMVLDDETRAFFEGYIEGKNTQPLLLSGGPGIGKTTAANILINETETIEDTLFLNASGRDRGIDTIREKIHRFGSTKTMGGGRKAIVLDEIDNLTHDAQKALRGVIEEISLTTDIIGTANYYAKLIDPLLSRFHHIPLEIKNTANGKKNMAKRCAKILKIEGVEFDNSAIVKIVNAMYPDFRKIVNSLQFYSTKTERITNDVVEGIISNSMDELVEIMKSKDFVEITKWTAENVKDPITFPLTFSSKLTTYVVDESFPEAIVHLNDCQHQQVNVPDKYLTLNAMLIKIAYDCEFK